MAPQETMSVEEMETRIAAVTAEIVTAATAGLDFVEYAKELVALQEKVQKTRISAKAGAINDAKTQLKDAISAMVKASPLAGLLEVDVTRIVWLLDDEGRPDLLVNSKRVGKGSSAVGGRRTKIVVMVDGVEYKPKAYIEAFGTAADKKHTYAKAWPSKVAKDIAAREEHASHEVVDVAARAAAEAAKASPDAAPEPAEATA